MTKPPRNGFWNCQNRWKLRSSSSDSQQHRGDRPAPSPHTSCNRQETHSETPRLTGSHISFAPYDTQPLFGHPWKLLGLHLSFVQRAVSATLFSPVPGTLCSSGSTFGIDSSLREKLILQSVFYPFIKSETVFLKVTQEGSPSFIWPGTRSSWCTNSGINCP